jgi:hypothetical protein
MNQISIVAGYLSLYLEVVDRSFTGIFFIIVRSKVIMNVHMYIHSTIPRRYKFCDSPVKMKMK